VSRMFRHPSMLGHRAVGGDVYRDESGEPIQFTEPILTPGMVARADRVLRSRYVGPTQTKVRATSSLLSRLGSCHCGRNINHTTQFNRRKPNSKAIRYYYCRDCETTPRNRIQAEVLEDYVVTKALSYLAKLEPGSTVMDEVGKRWLHRYSPDQLSRREELADEADAVRGQLSTLRRNYYELKRIPADEFTSMETNLNRRLTGLEDEVEPLPGATKRQKAIDLVGNLLVVGEEATATDLVSDVQVREAVGAVMDAEVALRNAHAALEAVIADIQAKRDA